MSELLEVVHDRVVPKFVIWVTVYDHVSILAHLVCNDAYWGVCIVSVKVSRADHQVRWFVVAKNLFNVV